MNGRTGEGPQAGFPERQAPAAGPSRSVERPAGAEIFNRVVRAVILVLSAGVMAAGLALAAGMVSLRTVPDEYRTVMGAVVFLYGLYRFVLAFLRSQRR